MNRDLRVLRHVLDGLSADIRQPTRVAPLPPQTSSRGSARLHPPVLGLGASVVVRTGPPAPTSGLRGTVTGRTFEAEPTYDVALPTGHVLTGLARRALEPAANSADEF